MKLSPEMAAKVLALAGLEAAPTVAKRSKYGNRKVAVDGVVFDSAKEAAHYGALMALQATGEVLAVERQVSYDLSVNGVVVCRYVADFRVTWRDGSVTVEDVKSAATRKNRAYRIKAKLLAACHGITIREV